MQKYQPRWSRHLENDSGMIILLITRMKRNIFCPTKEEIIEEHDHHLLLIATALPDRRSRILTMTNIYKVFDSLQSIFHT